MDSRGGYISKILYVETKESGPLGGYAWARPLLDPPMASVRIPLLLTLLTYTVYIPSGYEGCPEGEPDENAYIQCTPLLIG